MGTCVKTRLLVVEDEPLLRMTAVDIFEQEGFQVEEAANSEQALLLLRSRPSFDVLFTDVQMPGTMDGLALAHLISSEFPNVGLIIVSGHARPTLDELPAHAVFLAKPYEAWKAIEHARFVKRGA